MTYRADEIPREVCTDARRCWAQHACLFLVAAAGFLFCWTAFYPGFMSFDSLLQYKIAQTLQFTDWHPPIMSWIWSILNVFFAGPQGMLFFNLLLLWGGLLVWENDFASPHRKGLFLLIGFLPWVINFAGVLWKDVSMAYAVLLLAAFLYGSPRLSATRAVGLIVLAFLAINLRYNAVVAVLPFLWVGIGRIERVDTLLKKLAAFVLVIGLILAGSHYFNYRILHAQKTYPLNYILIDDLVNLSLAEKESLLPDVPYADIEGCRDAVIGGTALVGRHFCMIKKPSFHTSEPYQHSMAGVWLKAVTQHPVDYMRYRVAAFAYLLRSPSLEPYMIWQGGVDPNEMNIVQPRNGATMLVDWYVHKASSVAAFLFKPYAWLGLTLALFIATFLLQANGRMPMARALLVSGLLYLLSYGPATPMADFRYIYWSILAAHVAVAVLLTGPRLQWDSGISQRQRALLLAAIGACLLIAPNIARIFLR